MSDSEKIAVGYEAGMMHGAEIGRGLNEPNEPEHRALIGHAELPAGFYNNLVQRGMGNIGQEAQEMPHRTNMGGQFAPNPPKVAAPLDDALTSFIAERDALAKVVAALTDRLKPVLRPVQPQNGAGGSGGQAGIPPMSPVVAALRSECAAFAVQRCVLSTLLSRLDV